ncbi:hypothetical protein [Streptomyces justiciae]|uniref:hypothetical protein n=1 Tax=Streptomyces justiciae TaxID=2780140 RepID=UPI0021190C09|nr:hypothetical protein [Streptomyces justiciae]MCW8384531.1 hypothetical protein [Streptomyces justiciae]
MTITAGLTLTTTNCASSPSSSRPDHTDPTPTPAAHTGSSTPRTQTGQTTVLAELDGPAGLTLVLTAAERDQTGYLTLRGTLHNTSNALVTVPAQLRGTEDDIVQTSPSLAGATLIDFTHHKRYYVLRDTDGNPLTTIGLTRLKPHQKAEVFMQFPAPPATTSHVGFQMPLFDTTTITITG